MAENFDTSEMKAKLEEARGKFREAVADALEKAAKDVLDESRRYVPTDTGTLAASGKVQVDRAAFSATIGYGSGQAEDYAVIQHENTHDHHDDGGPKFLERPLVKARQQMAQTIAAEIKKLT